MRPVKLLIIICFLTSLAGNAVSKLPSVGFIINNGTLAYDTLSNLSYASTYILEADAILQKTGSNIVLLGKDGTIRSVIKLSAGLNLIFISQITDGRYLAQALYEKDWPLTAYYAGKLTLLYWNPFCYSIVQSLESGVAVYKLAKAVIDLGVKWNEHFKDFAKTASCNLI